jgi:crossover junction endodeoxyribonuclease RuvC
VRVFGIDPGSIRTGYGCVDSDGTRHRLVACGAVSVGGHDGLPHRLKAIHDGLLEQLSACRPDCVAIESLFHAHNVKSALVLGHARGVAVLASVQAGVPLIEYSPTEIKMAVTGYGRAEKSQLQQMVQLLLGLDTPPTPHDASDALAVAICHAHAGRTSSSRGSRVPLDQRSWRHVKLPQGVRRQAP